MSDLDNETFFVTSAYVENLTNVKWVGLYNTNNRINNGHK